MPWTALTLFGLAIASWQFARHRHNDIGRALWSLSCIVCTLGGLFTAPALLQGAVLIGLLVYPTHTGKPKSFDRLSCPGLCLSCNGCQP